jgi:RNA-splicing ligase RtcB
VQTLKGNIRVFCRVRPLAVDKLEVEAMEDGHPVISFPDTGTFSTLMHAPLQLCALESFSSSQHEAGRALG